MNTKKYSKLKSIVDRFANTYVKTRKRDRENARNSNIQIGLIFKLHIYA